MFTCFYICRVIFYLFLRLLGTMTKRFKGYTKRTHDSLFYGEILSLLIEAYLEFVISGYLNSKVPLKSTSGEIAATYTGYMSLVLTCFILPGTFLWII